MRDNHSSPRGLAVAVAFAVSGDLTVALGRSERLAAAVRLPQFRRRAQQPGGAGNPRAIRRCPGLPGVPGVPGGPGGNGQPGATTAPNGGGQTTGPGAPTTPATGTVAPDGGGFGPSQAISVFAYFPAADSEAQGRAEFFRQQQVAAGIPAQVLRTKDFPRLQIIPGSTPADTFVVYVGPFNTLAEAQNRCATQPSLGTQCRAVIPSPPA